MLKITCAQCQALKLFILVRNQTRKIEHPHTLKMNADKEPLNSEKYLRAIPHFHQVQFFPPHSCTISLHNLYK